MSPRLLQNFNGCRAHLVTASKPAAEALEITLGKLGVSVVHPTFGDGRAQIDLASLQVDRDILFIDGDLDDPVAPDMVAGSRQPPVPVIKGCLARPKPVCSLPMINWQ